VSFFFPWSYLGFICMIDDGDWVGANGFVCYKPPITFQPPPPPGSTNNNNNSNNGAATQPKAPAGPAHPDLITRYNLKDKIDTASPAAGESSAETTGAKGSGKGWSSNRDERQSLLQRRRDQMILEARRKMEAKIAAEKAAGGAS
jgi:coupling of ubiquitin conjugation to ER degradation protein 1